MGVVADREREATRAANPASLAGRLDNVANPGQIWRPSWRGKVDCDWINLCVLVLVPIPFSTLPVNGTWLFVRVPTVPPRL